MRGTACKSRPNSLHTGVVTIGGNEVGRMSVMKWLAFLIWIVPFYVGAVEKETTAQELVGVIQKNIPKGWLVTYEPEYNWIEVVMQRPVMPSPNNPNISIDERSALGRYRFTFRVETYISPVDYKKQSEENSKIRRQLNAMSVDMRLISHKFDSFPSKNDEEQKKVNEYNALKGQLLHLPDFYYKDISLSWGMAEGKSSVSSVVEDNARKECNQTLETVLGIVSKYDALEK